MPPKGSRGGSRATNSDATAKPAARGTRGRGRGRGRATTTKSLSRSAASKSFIDEEAEEDNNLLESEEEEDTMDARLETDAGEVGVVVNDRQSDSEIERQTDPLPYGPFSRPSTSPIRSKNVVTVETPPTPSPNKTKKRPAPASPDVDDDYEDDEDRQPLPKTPSRRGRVKKAPPKSAEYIESSDGDEPALSNKNKFPAVIKDKESNIFLASGEEDDNDDNRMVARLKRNRSPKKRARTERVDDSDDAGNASVASQHSESGKSKPVLPPKPEVVVPVRSAAGVVMTDKHFVAGTKRPTFTRGNFLPDQIAQLEAELAAARASFEAEAMTGAKSNQDDSEVSDVRPESPTPKKRVAVAKKVKVEKEDKKVPVTPVKKPSLANKKSVSALKVNVKPDNDILDDNLDVTQTPMSSLAKALEKQQLALETQAKAGGQTSKGTQDGGRKGDEEPQFYCAVSDPSDPRNARFISPSLKWSYTPANAPPYSFRPKQEHPAGQILNTVQFDTVLSQCEIPSRSNHAARLILWLTFASHASFVINPARSDPAKYYLDDSGNIMSRADKARVGLCLYGLLTSSHVQTALVTKGGQSMKSVTIQPFSLEWQRLFAFLCVVFKKKGMEVRAYDNVLSISSRMGKENNMSSDVIAVDDDVDLLGTDVYGYMKTLVNKGYTRPEDHILVYDATRYYQRPSGKGKAHGLLNPTQMRNCPLWTEEVPVGSMVYVNCTARTWQNAGKDVISFNLLNVVILALPPGYDPAPLAGEEDFSERDIA